MHEAGKQANSLQLLVPRILKKQTAKVKRE